MSSSTPPAYHATNDDFINDPNSMKFIFTSPDDIVDNNINGMMDQLQMMAEPVTHSKKKTRALNNLKKFSNNPVRENALSLRTRRKSTLPNPRTTLRSLR